MSTQSPISDLPSTVAARHPISDLPSSTPNGALRLGVMSCSSFALRAMVPAIAEMPSIKLIAIASRDSAKATEAATKFGARALDSYQALLDDPEIDAIYMPLPTGLHEEWVHKALDAFPSIGNFRMTISGESLGF